MQLLNKKLKLKKCKPKKKNKKLTNLLLKSKFKNKKYKFKIVKLKFKQRNVVLLKKMSNIKKQSLKKSFKLQVHLLSKQKKLWIQFKKKIFKLLNHLQIHQEVYHKFFRLLFGYYQDSLKKSIQIQNRKSRNNLIGKLLKN